MPIRSGELTVRHFRQDSTQQSIELLTLRMLLSWKPCALRMPTQTHWCRLISRPPMYSTWTITLTSPPASPWCRQISYCSATSSALRLRLSTFRIQQFGAKSSPMPWCVWAKSTWSLAWWVRSAQTVAFEVRSGKAIKESIRAYKDKKCLPETVIGFDLHRVLVCQDWSVIPEHELVKDGPYCSQDSVETP